MHSRKKHKTNRIHKIHLLRSEMCLLIVTLLKSCSLNIILNLFRSTRKRSSRFRRIYRSTKSTNWSEATPSTWRKHLMSGRRSSPTEKRSSTPRWRWYQTNASNCMFSVKQSQRARRWRTNRSKNQHRLAVTANRVLRIFIQLKDQNYDCFNSPEHIIKVM